MVIRDVGLHFSCKFDASVILFLRMNLGAFAPLQCFESFRKIGVSFSLIVWLLMPSTWSWDFLIRKLLIIGSSFLFFMV